MLMLRYVSVEFLMVTGSGCVPVYLSDEQVGKGRRSI